MKKQFFLRRLTALILGICCLFSMASAEISADELPVCIKLTWDAKSDGPDLEIAAFVSGMLDDGSEVIPMETEGEYISSGDYSHVGSHYIYGNGLTELWFYRLDGNFSITVEWGNPELLFSGASYADYNLNIEISTAEETLLNIAANPDKAMAEGRQNPVPLDDYYNRGATGVWYIGLRLDHGSIVPLFSEYEAAEQPESQHTEEIQTQSVESYNEAGFKTASEWMENGVVTAYTYWDYDESNRLIQIRYANMLEPDEVAICFTYENGAVQMYNALGTLLAEDESALAAAQQLGMGYIVEEALNGTA